MRLVQFVDTAEYVRTNCWQNQLFAHLHPQCDVHILVTASDVANGRLIPEADVYLSTLKARTIDRLRLQMKQCLGDRPLHVYDQDPWEAFIDTGTLRGAYHRLADDLNVKSFILTSKWWTDFVASQGFKTQFVQMWMNPTLCDYGVSWEARPVSVGFMGSLHPYRKAAITELARMGIDVQVFSPGRYEDFLSRLSQMQFFFHGEAGDSWTIDGKPVGQNALWAKEIEIASRGCYALRQYEDEAEAYMASDIPCILPFIDIADIPGIVKNTLADPLASTNSRISVDRVRSHRGWFKLADL